MLSTLVAAIRDWAGELGGIGLFVIAALDSSFLSFPQVNDLLIIVLSTRSPGRMAYYAAMTTMGSLVGCFALYAVARRGGDVFLRKRFKGHHVDRALALYQKYGLLAVIVPSLLPPPTPFKLFVLLAGAAGVSKVRFAAAIAIGRGLRYFGQGYLAVLYGEQAADLVRAYGAEAGVALAAAAVAAGVIYYLARRRGSRAGGRGPTADSRRTAGGSGTPPF
ncbi:MAG: VTT domain-containing protein [Acidobacteriota bacterium]